MKRIQNERQERKTIGMVSLANIVFGLVAYFSDATSYLSWFNVLAGSLSIFFTAPIGAVIERTIGEEYGTLSVGAGLALVAIIGVARHNETWLIAGTFLFAAAYGLLGLAGRKLIHPAVRARLAHARASWRDENPR